MSLPDICKKIIRYSFYALFFLVPLVFTTDNSELFELSKMWLTWGITTVIITAWLTRMVVTRNFRIQKTPLDIPIMLFLSSQIISTLFSLDMRISIWGFYSRFNGGLLSTITYILLYYALVSNLSIRAVRHILYVSVASATLVVLWGIPAHFGVDPTCYIVRGSFDISCWTDQFVPTVRIFSTLGQPAWMAAYLSFLIPVALAFFLKASLPQKKGKEDGKQTMALSSPLALGLIFINALFYIALIFANTRAGYIAFLIGNGVFWLVLLLVDFRRYLSIFLICSVVYVACNFVFGIPLEQLRNFTVGVPVQQAVMQTIGPKQTQPSTQSGGENPTPSPKPQVSGQKNEQVEVGVANITDSGNIRKNVWAGAISAWKANPIFGTGVETFAFAYYKHKPVGQNLTSEWDYLYNKAHNEYLNYLATTGIYGLVTYLLLIVWFWFLMLRWFYHVGFQLLHGEKKVTMIHRFFSEIVHLFKHEPKDSELKPEYAYLILGLLAGLITIYISNFFGFSVVIVNLYLFLTPGFIFILQKRFVKKPGPENASVPAQSATLATPGLVITGIIWLLCFYILYLLIRFWNADRAYALGYNLDRVGQYQQAYPTLLKSVEKRGKEPVFQDELAYNSAVLAGLYTEQKDTQNAEKFRQQALSLSDEVATSHPNNIVFIKNRVRMLYELSKIDPQYLGLALTSIQKAYELAPNDAKIGYNYGVLLGQTGNVNQGIAVLEQTKKIKTDFRDVYFALGLFYRDLATRSGKTVVNQEHEKKAEENMQYILKNLNPNDKQVTDQLTSWGISSN
ncbi:MAG: O-antigen ligase family protein [bacterium]|nr:O-antigen ligase family protein [bacterium]